MRKYETNFHLASTDMGNGEMNVTLQFRLKKKLAGWMGHVMVVVAITILVMLLNHPDTQAILHKLIEGLLGM